MNNIDSITRALKAQVHIAHRAQAAVNSLLQFRTVEVISDFNDQPYGRSKKSLKGQHFMVQTVILELHDKEIHLLLKGCTCGVVLWQDVKLVEEKSRSTQQEDLTS